MKPGYVMARTKRRNLKNIDHKEYVPPKITKVTLGSSWGATPELVKI